MAALGLMVAAICVTLAVSDPVSAEDTHSIVEIRNDLRGLRSQWESPTYLVTPPAPGDDRPTEVVILHDGTHLSLALRTDAVGDHQTISDVAIRSGGRGCDEVSEFVVHEYEYIQADGIFVLEDQLTMALDLHEVCEQGLGFHASIRINSSRTVDLDWVDAPAPWVDEVDIAVGYTGAWRQQGRLWQDDRRTVGRATAEDIRIHVGEPFDTTAGSLYFRPAPGNPVATGRYDLDPSGASSLVASGGGGGCTGLGVGWFEIHELSIDRFGVITSLSLDFESACAAGSIRLAHDAPIDLVALEAFWFKDFRQLRESECPHITDSILRLYTAYFGREPDLDGYDYWLAEYKDGLAGLPTMSQAFADSDEFRLTYGSLDNGAFVDLVYRNVLGRLPDPAGRAHWVDALDRGYPRGSVMIAFSESQEYVIQTQTSASLAGWLQWYGHAVRFDCESRDRASVGVSASGIDDPKFDALLVNPTSAPIGYRMFVATPDSFTIIEDIVLDPNSFQIWWGVSVEEFAPGGQVVVFETTAVADVAVVVYDGWPGEWRSPYTDFVQFGAGAGLRAAGSLDVLDAVLAGRTGSAVSVDDLVLADVSG